MASRDCLPWGITTSSGPELRNLLPAALRWLGSSATAARAPAFVDRLLEALAEGAEWLNHPVLAPVSMSVDGDAKLDVQLVHWVAVRAGLPAPATLSLPEPMWIYGLQGPQQVPAGPLGLLGRPSASGPEKVGLDPLWDCLGSGAPTRLGIPDSWSWAATPPADAGEEQRLLGEVARFERVLDRLRESLPLVHAWVCAATKVVLPYRASGGSKFKSASRIDLPGAVFLDIGVAPHHLLEGLVHESAHRHFFRIEARGPLVDPLHRGLYSSPLRADPRPLRGVFLAFHALTFMVQLYRDMAATDRLPTRSSELADLTSRAADAEAVLAGASAHLTASGRALLAETSRVAQPRVYEAA